MVGCVGVDRVVVWAVYLGDSVGARKSAEWDTKYAPRTFLKHGFPL